MFANVGIDSQQHTGLAFGMGVERFTIALRHMVSALDLAVVLRMIRDFCATFGLRGTGRRLYCDLRLKEFCNTTKFWQKWLEDCVGCGGARRAIQLADGNHHGGLGSWMLLRR